MSNVYCPGVLVEGYGCNGDAKEKLKERAKKKSDRNEERGGRIKKKKQAYSSSSSSFSTTLLQTNRYLTPHAKTIPA